MSTPIENISHLLFHASYQSGILYFQLSHGIERSYSNQNSFSQKKVGIKNKRLIAAWNNDYLIHLFTG
jgi:hypothetical protein